MSRRRSRGLTAGAVEPESSSKRIALRIQDGDKVWHGTLVYEDGKPFDPSEAAKLRAARKLEAAHIKAEADERAGKTPVPNKRRERAPED